MYRKVEIRQIVFVLKAVSIVSVYYHTYLDNRYVCISIKYIFHAIFPAL